MTLGTKKKSFRHAVYHDDKMTMIEIITQSGLKESTLREEWAKAMAAKRLKVPCHCQNCRLSEEGK